MEKQKKFWIKVCLVNLSIVALLGLTMRTKMLFPLPSIDYKNILNAHSHYAFAGWVGLALILLLVYNILPPVLSQKRIYQWILAGVQFSAMGMLFSFPFIGYAGISIFFSTLYIIVTYVFAAVYMADLKKAKPDRNVYLLGIGSVISLVVSSIGPFGLAYVLISESGDSVLYRDCIYTYLHFQYNGFFTLAVFALVFDRLIKKGFVPGKNIWLFTVYTVLSIIPSLFLSLLWHGNNYFLMIGVAACILMLISLVYFMSLFKSREHIMAWGKPLARALYVFAILSFILKTILNLGTIFPQLSHAVYADRPLIIGFLHLVFLGFVSFYLLAHFLEEGVFSKNERVIRYPVWIFSIGIIANELFLMVQGLEILFKTNSDLYTLFLWIAAILLFAGAVLMAVTSFPKRTVVKIKEP